MSIIQSKAERTQISAKAFTLTWNINHGTMVQCATLVEHIQAMDGLLHWEYAIEEKPDGLGKKYHLHMFMLFSQDKIRDSLKKNILRRGQSIGKKDDPTAKITAVSVELKRAFDEHWLTGYCHGKECPEVVKADVSGPFNEEWRIHFPSQAEQKEFQQVAHSTDEVMEKLAIEFDKWCMPPEDQDKMVYLANGSYDDYQEGKINLTELCSIFLYDMMVKKQKMKVPNERRKLVHLRQMFEYYLSNREGKFGYWKWFMTQNELEATPSAIKKKNELKAKETNDFIKSILE